MTYIEEKIKWLNNHKVKYFQGECGAISIDLKDIPNELREEFHDFSYALQKKYEKMEKNNILILEKERLAWSLKTFPEATALSSILKFQEELKEVRENIYERVKDTSEYADCLMCLLDSAGRDGIIAEMIYANAKSIHLSSTNHDTNAMNYIDPLMSTSNKIKNNINNGLVRSHFYSEAIGQLLNVALRDGVSEEEILTAFKEKFEINKNRVWVKNPDNTYSHVKN